MIPIKKKIRVLIVEDSPVVRKLLTNILSQDPIFEVVGHATNGKEAISYSKLYNPDIISMDMIMPIMDGLEATRIIMQENPIPIVIVSTIYTEHEKFLAIEELNAGAVAVIKKPEGPTHPKYEKSASKYKNIIKLMSEIRVVKRGTRKEASPTSINNRDKRETTPIECSALEKVSLIAIGASAGGPEATRQILQNLVYPIKVPIVIVQHIDPHFTQSYASWLADSIKSRVILAQDGDLLEAGVIYVAPGNKHLAIDSGMRVLLTTDSTLESNSNHKPSIDHLFFSLSTLRPNETISILLSGMGRDGAKGLLKIKERGGYTLVQNRESSLIFGMPGEAIKLEAACKTLYPIDIANEINYLLSKTK